MEIKTIKYDGIPYGQQRYTPGSKGQNSLYEAYRHQFGGTWGVESMSETDQSKQMHQSAYVDQRGLGAFPFKIPTLNERDAELIMQLPRGGQVPELVDSSGDTNRSILPSVPNTNPEDVQNEMRMQNLRDFQRELESKGQNNVTTSNNENKTEDIKDIYNGDQSTPSKNPAGIKDGGIQKPKSSITKSILNALSKWRPPNQEKEDRLRIIPTEPVPPPRESKQPVPPPRESKQPIPPPRAPVAPPRAPVPPPRKKVAPKYWWETSSNYKSLDLPESNEYHYPGGKSKCSKKKGKNNGKNKGGDCIKLTDNVFETSATSGPVPTNMEDVKSTKHDASFEKLKHDLETKQKAQKNNSPEDEKMKPPKSKNTIPAKTFEKILNEMQYEKSKKTKTGCYDYRNFLLNLKTKYILNKSQKAIVAERLSVVDNLIDKFNEKPSLTVDTTNIPQNTASSSSVGTLSSYKSSSRSGEAGGGFVERSPDKQSEKRSAEDKLESGKTKSAKGSSKASSKSSSSKSSSSKASSKSSSSKSLESSKSPKQISSKEMSFKEFLKSVYPKNPTDYSGRLQRYSELCKFKSLNDEDKALQDEEEAKCLDAINKSAEVRPGDSPKSRRSSKSGKSASPKSGHSTSSSDAPAKKTRSKKPEASPESFTSFFANLYTKNPKVYRTIKEKFIAVKEFQTINEKDEALKQKTLLELLAKLKKFDEHDNQDHDDKFLFDIKK